VSEAPFLPEHFRRIDERDDALFYAQPRLVTHIDHHAIGAIRRLYAEVLPADGEVLDLMSSWVSHMPDELSACRVTGLGMNETELRENDRLDSRVVHDINADPRLPFDDASFDGCVIAVSVQYLIHPVEVFRHVARVLLPGAPFVVTFSNRLFPEKAIALWYATNDEQHARIVQAYFHYAGGFARVTAQDRSPKLGIPTDPLYAVWGYRDID
jgi:SAM-dependent methyltransferase